MKNYFFLRLIQSFLAFSSFFLKEADCFILCYSVDNRASFENILHKWMPELKSNERWPIAVILTGKYITKVI